MKAVMKAIIKDLSAKLLAALSQPSGWVGIIGLVSVACVHISPENTEFIATVGAATVSSIAAFIEW